MRNSLRKSRVISAFAIGAVGALALTSCGGGVSDSGSSDSGNKASSTYVEATSGELNLYTWSDYFPDELVKKFTKDTGSSSTSTTSTATKTLRPNFAPLTARGTTWWCRATTWLRF
ncbi:hypothetical protein [Leucobacter coleopterorum]|uniref:hypothetical protein n=1 Tax=Leucobacter coleopterorum TaxID=2714933 RepID=UPI001FCBC5C1|nr:hypothetical protein [Leucobacter coleopterorum]